MSVLRHVGVAAASIALTIGALFAFALLSDATDGHGKMRSALSELALEARTGKVDSIEVHGRRYVYRLKDSPRSREAFGPKTTEAEARTFFQPPAPALHAPKVTVD